jgi:ABC-2 type transport system ATP-binding protein
LRDLTLEVPRGEVVALLGPNGAGKTTALRTIANVLQPSAGRALVLGVDSRRLGPRELQRIGYVSENQQLPDALSGEELFAFLAPLYPRWDAAFARALAEQFQLPLRRPLRQLSRGQRVKTALVSSLAGRPELLLLDEPFAGLDPLVREEVIDGVLALEGDWTVLLSSHDVDEVERLADRVAVLDRGRLALAEPTEALLARHRAVEVVLPGDEAVLPPLPDAWLQPQRAGRSLRFVVSDFEEARTLGVVQRVLPGARLVAAAPMPLKAVFLALARRFRLHEGEEAA